MAAASPSSGAASSNGAAIAMAVAKIAGKEDDLTEQILRLQTEEKEMKAKKQRVQKDLRNARRKKTRLTKHARLLTDSDLFQIMQMREARKKEDPAAPGNEGAKEGKAQISSAAQPDGQAVAAPSSQSESGHFEDGEEEDQRKFEVRES